MSELCSVCAAGIHGISPPPIRSRVGVSESSATNVRNSFVASSLPSELRIDPHVIGFLAHEDFCRNAGLAKEALRKVLIVIT